MSNTRLHVLGSLKGPGQRALARGSSGTHFPVSPGTEDANFPGAQEGRTSLSQLLMVREVLDFLLLTVLYCEDLISPEVFAVFSM